VVQFDEIRMISAAGMASGAKPRMSNQHLYEQDFYACANQQPVLLRDGRFSEADMRAYGTAMIQTESETGLSEATFPATCPWSFDQMMDPDFWPAETWSEHSA
jgi:hypothetical protein